MSTENIVSGDVSTRLKKILSIIPIILSSIVGLILLVAALPKAFEIDLFIRQIRDYEIITNPLLIIFSAWGLIIFECFLGAALVVNYRPKIAVPLGGILFLIFIAATGYAWATGVTDDCGCFGAWLERTPEAAMLEDIIIFAAILVAWKWNRSFKNWPFFLKELIIVVVLLTGLLIPITAGPLLDRINAAVTGPAEEGSEQFVLEDFSHKDLSAGKHIIIVLATDCSHCRAEMDSLNMIAEDEDLPDVISVCINGEEQIEEFEFDFEPAFGLYQIRDDDFWRLLGDGEIPRTILINNGIVLKKWDFAPPEIDEIKAALGS
ncbi:MAG: MauE/DoxX family redox-associated membrane protein [Desulfobacteraceae bacterium]